MNCEEEKGRARRKGKQEKGEGSNGRDKEKNGAKRETDACPYAVLKNALLKPCCLLGLAHSIFVPTLRCQNWEEPSLSLSQGNQMGETNHRPPSDEAKLSSTRTKSNRPCKNRYLFCLPRCASIEKAE